MASSRSGGGSGGGWTGEYDEDAWEFGGGDGIAGETAVSLLDAFEDFEVRAEKQTAALIEATNGQLFQARDCQDSKGDAADDVPAHFYWSDQYRQTKPPDFGQWRDRFLYLQAEGHTPHHYESQEHIQWVPHTEAEVERASPNGTADRQDSSVVLCISGLSCLQEPPDDPDLLEEEVFACDGSMEEILAEDVVDGCRADADPNAERHEEARNGCLSPRLSRLEEQLNAATLAIFSSTAATMLAPVLKTLLLRKQADLRAARELAEANYREEIVRQQAAEEETRAMEEQQMAIEEARQHALVVAVMEAEQRKAEQREQLEKERLEENDEEEIKIRTLAYTHTREWFQPNKKCFSHRGRQFTYLKPVLMVKDSPSLVGDDSLPPGSQGPASHAVRTREGEQEQCPLQSKSAQPSLGWSIGDIDGTRSSPGTSRPRHSRGMERQPPGDSLEVDCDDGKRVRLPQIKPHAAKQARDAPAPRAKAATSFEDGGMEYSSVRAPSKVYVVEPYRIPPPLLTAFGAPRKARASSYRSNQTNDSTSGKDRSGRE